MKRDEKNDKIALFIVVVFTVVIGMIFANMNLLKVKAATQYDDTETYKVRSGLWPNPILYKLTVTQWWNVDDGEIYAESYNSDTYAQYPWVATWTHHDVIDASMDDSWWKIKTKTRFEFGLYLEHFIDMRATVYNNGYVYWSNTDY